MPKNEWPIDGESLNVATLTELIKNKRSKVLILPNILEKSRKAADFVIKESKNKVIYGVNTGFGPMAYKLIGTQQLEELQLNLVRSHSTGIGEPVNPNFTLSAMIVRLNTLAKGYSGVSPELLNHLAFFINEKIIPVVPEHGAVGTSGDLVQLAHIALALIGEGKSFYKGEILPTKTILKTLGIKPYKLKPKEGLSLINGTSFMTGISALLCAEAQNLLNLGCLTAAMAMECVGAFDESVSEELQKVRPHNGQVLAAKKIRSLLTGSKRLHNRADFEKKYTLNGHVQTMNMEAQEVYSIRCSPQILGPIWDTIQETQKVVETEMNSVTDNPVVDIKNKKFLHGGNFHGDYVASAIDKLKAAVIKLTMLSERRVNFFMHDKKNRLFPPFLNLKEPGLTLGLQGMQFVATSTAANSQSLGYPHHLHSIPTNGENQDVVSMGTDAALLTAKVIDNAYIVMAAEFATLTQAMEFSEIKKYSKNSLAQYNQVRKFFPKVTEDRELSLQLNRLKNNLKVFYEL